jgi:hypothetical protein
MRLSYPSSSGLYQMNKDVVLFSRKSHSVRIVLAVSLLAALVSIPGCGGGEGGVSEFDQLQAEKAKSMEGLKAKGVKAVEKAYPQGTAWAIDLSGQTITEDTFEALKRVGHISELNFSGSTLSDEHAPLLNDEYIRGTLIKLDVSKTAFSDAGLAQLKDANLLMELIVTGSKVTQAGVSKFAQDRQANPNVPAMFKNVKVTM